MKQNRQIGPYEVFSIGLGCMPMSGMPPTRAYILDKREQAIETINCALDAGVTLLDTSDVYAPTWDTFGHNEKLVGEAVRTWNAPAEKKAKVVIATKGGITRAPGTDWFGIPGRNSNVHYLYRAVEASALRLGVDKIQIWQHHRLDTSILFEEQVESIFKLKEQGIVQNIGVSNYNAEQLLRAIKIGGTVKEGGIVSVQNEWSPRYRLGGDVRNICEENGIAFLPWSPLAGIGNGQSLEKGQYGSFDVLAARKNVSVYALTIAWHLANSAASIPIPGATRKESILDSLSGVSVELSEEELKELNESLPPSSELQEELISQPLFRA
jgi:aryl-alcohol dehydrogenase-like predicted oxidoreductase